MLGDLLPRGRAALRHALLPSWARLARCGLLLGLCACGSGYVDAPLGYDARPANSTCKPPPRPPSGSASTGLALSRDFAELSFSDPVALLQAPGENDRYFVIEQGGVLRAFRRGDTSATAVLTFPAAAITSGGETGFLGFAFAPDWTSSHTAYASRTAPGGATGLRSVITRIRSTDGGLSFDRATEQELLVVEQPYSNHNGGWIAFGPDGDLYLGLGDGGSGGDPQGNGQNLGTLLGKMLRIDVAGAGAYAVPADNPFVGSVGVRPEIWAYGLRNPWRFSFDRGSGDLWVGDVGQGAWEEVDVLARGGNYGWNTREGRHCYNAGSCSSAGLIDPVAEYSHQEGQSITGGYVYRGSAVPALVGVYVYADYVAGTVWGLFPDAAGVLQPSVLVSSGFNISSFGEDNAGELYVIDYSGKIFRITSSGTPGLLGFPQKLSLTGCVDPADARQPASGVIPYAVNAPFWSDGAAKDRFLAIPDGAQIGIRPDGDLEFPIGTVLMKRFSLSNLFIETRLFMRHADGSWAGYSYEWDVDQRDASLVVGPRTTTQPGGQRWLYPSGAQCLTCHTEAAGYALGLELAQLARVVEYPATGRRAPQLDTLAAMGLFSSAPPATQPLPVPYGATADPLTSTLEQRARAWLHSNCASCHRPNGTGRGPQDFRYSQPFSQTQLCNVAPTAGDLGVPGARLIVPGSPETSLVSLRIHARDSVQMPPLASLIPDEEGAALVDAWIRSLSGCP